MTRRKTMPRCGSDPPSDPPGSDPAAPEAPAHHPIEERTTLRATLDPQGELVLCLLDATSTFRAREAEDGGRGGALRALQAVILFMQAQHFRADLYAPLARLAVSLDAVARGAAGTPPMFVRPKRAARPPVPPAVLAQRGVLAAIAEMGMGGGLSAEEAARFAAREGSGMECFADVESADWKAVLRWRDRAMAGRPVEDVDAGTYSAFLKKWRDAGQPGRDQLRDWIAAATDLFGRGSTKLEKGGG